MNFNCFQVKTVSELSDYLSSKGKKISDFDEMLETNKAYIFRLNSGKTIMLPNDIRPFSKGIIFSSESCYQNYVGLDEFPVKNREPLVVEKYQDELKSIDLKKIVNAFLPIVGIKNDILELDNKSLVFLLEQVKKKRKKLTEKQIFLAVLLLGELIKDEYKGCWVLIKKYGQFNPYYIPAIEYETGKILLLLDFASSYLNNSEITLYNYIRLPYIKAPSLELGNNFFVNNFNGYYYPQVRRRLKN